MFILLLLLLLYANPITAYGYDAGSDQAACGRPQQRTGRMHKPPCDLVRNGYCVSAGNGYPWHAVRRFVKENQGLMRRMYGDQQHGSVLKGEFDSFNTPKFYDRKMYAKQGQKYFDFELDNQVHPLNEPRYLRDDDISNDDVLNTKFVYSEEPSISIKLADLRTAPPNFRPTTPKLTTPEEPIIDDGTTIEDYSTEITTTTTLTTSSSTTTTTTEQPPTIPDTKPSNFDGSLNTILFQDMEEPEIDYTNMRGVNACPVKEEVVAPFWANSTRGEVLALLNMYPFEQYVHWEKCSHEHRQMYCRDGCRCEQQYRLHRLLAYDPNNECRGIFSDWFRFPSCCVCKCYNLAPAEFRVTSRSPRTRTFNDDWYLKSLVVPSG